MHNRNRFSPITLTVKRPVLHFILNSSFANSLFTYVVNHFLDRFLFVCTSVEKSRIYHFSVSGVSAILNISAFYNLDDFDSKFFCKIVITIIMRGNSHNSAGTVAHHNIIRNIHRNFFTADRIYSFKSFNANPSLIFNKLSTLKFCLFSTHIPI